MLIIFSQIWSMWGVGGALCYDCHTGCLCAKAGTWFPQITMDEAPRHLNLFLTVRLLYFPSASSMFLASALHSVRVHADRLDIWKHKSLPEKAQDWCL
jgi:hypothetical protein